MSESVSSFASVACHDTKHTFTAMSTDKESSCSATVPRWRWPGGGHWKRFKQDNVSFSLLRVAGVDGHLQADQVTKNLSLAL